MHAKKFPKLKKESVKGIALLGFVETTLEYVFFYIGLSYASGFKGAILNPTIYFYDGYFSSLFL